MELVYEGGLLNCIKTTQTRTMGRVKERRIEGEWERQRVREREKERKRERALEEERESRG